MSLSATTVLSPCHRRGCHTGDPHQADHEAVHLRGEEQLSHVALPHRRQSCVLNMKRTLADMAGWTFTRYGESLDATPDIDLPDRRPVPADVRLLVDEARIGGTAGMLLCLDREQRLIYILGAIFGVTDVVGAETPGDRSRELPAEGAGQARSPQLSARQVRPDQRGRRADRRILAAALRR